MERFKDLTTAFTMTDVAIVLALGFVLSMVIAWSYRHTHHGTSYSQTYAQTLVILGMVVAMIMLIIGSNLARAFSLVGALSIIRFRNAVKETRDVGFVFLVMAIGMACGTRFYALAAFGTTVFTAVIMLMDKLDMFAKRVTERILRVRLPADRDYETAFEPVFNEYLSDNRLISVETVSAGVLQEAVYSVVLKSDVEPQKFLEAVRAVNDNHKVALVMGQQEVDL
ncbi:MAG: DUF4956 domain-containing protein [Deltaproteobacteria bacterium RIFOXYA12_FULL_58_15]|nr:MAG: DUF4956 domain-containing protein [Deltaproteobacteria bacterium RIFOXYA12_FULL_58_15]OGR08220.1 MAG: DUF4956 domain-containing protein [Deltaproteobacteria bacterium RIFOXYB12_FULL_58_9]